MHGFTNVFSNFNLLLSLHIQNAQQSMIYHATTFEQFFDIIHTDFVETSCLIKKKNAANVRTFSVLLNFFINHKINLPIRNIKNIYMFDVANRLLF